MTKPLRFLALPAERRALAFGQTAAGLAASTVMVEKDFWVCWLLSLLFADAALGPHLVFKGGTSLSKVFGVIDRFSEDIDLSLSPAFVGADEAAFEALTSRTRRDAALALMQKQCGDCARDEVAPRPEAAIAAQIGPRENRQPWLTYEDDAAARRTHHSAGTRLRAYAAHVPHRAAELRADTRPVGGGRTHAQRQRGSMSNFAFLLAEFPAVHEDARHRLPRSQPRRR